MATNKQQRKKKKHEKHLKDIRYKKELEQRREKAYEFGDLADFAFHDGNFHESLSCALKRLRIPPYDEYIDYIALQSAKMLDDKDAIYEILSIKWKNRFPGRREDYYELAFIAMNRKNYDFAREVCHGLLSNQVRLIRPLTKKLISDIQKLLREIDTREKIEAKIAEYEYILQNQAVGEIPEKELPSETVESPAEVALEPEEILEPEMNFQIDGSRIVEALEKINISGINELQLTLEGYKLTFRSSFEQLICLPTLENVQSLWYQEETARKVMKMFRGRAILADEVGLGKTIEACIVLKEYFLRGLVRSALILTPSSLVNQWQSELADKFKLGFVSTNDSIFKENPEQFWENPFILASINIAKGKRHFDRVINQKYDIVVVDEAHHLKNRNTLNWQLINSIQKNYLLLLTATPVENNLEELFNLVTLLKPGHLKTRKAFIAEFVSRGNPTDPQNRDKLRQLLKEVMLRNTRSITRLQLPARFANTVKISPTSEEQAFYDAIGRFISTNSSQTKTNFSKHIFQQLLAATGSSHLAALKMLEKMKENSQNGFSQQIELLIALGKKIKLASKTKQVIELLKASKVQVIVFVNYMATIDYLRSIFEAHGLSHTVFSGNLNLNEKHAAIEAFREGRQILLSSGSGGEGHNLQFCHTLINYDLPWNPMEIEQRIGRIHRIGQTQEVQIYNFCASGSLEDHILEVLDRKINMFELVVGEIDMILGRLRGEEEFSDIVFDLWIKNTGADQRKHAFNTLATRLKKLRSAYEKSKELDEKLFQEDFGV
jgi:SNF2 family DNA or RNA helicase